MEKQSIIINNILSNDNLNRAYKQVVKNKGAAGIDGMECEALFSHLRTNGAQLKESIRNQAYNPLPVKRVEIPKEDGSKEDERTKSYFKTMVEAIEDSNTGYHWDWNEKGLKGKVVGCLVRAEEWEMNGWSGWCTKPFRFVPVADIRENRFKIPKDKPLRQDATPKAAVNSAAAAEEILPIDDLPF